jgi:hypothetical protein
MVAVGRSHDSCKNRNDFVEDKSTTNLMLFYLEGDGNAAEITLYARNHTEGYYSQQHSQMERSVCTAARVDHSFAG